MSSPVVICLILSIFVCYSTSRDAYFSIQSASPANPVTSAVEDPSPSVAVEDVCSSVVLNCGDHRVGDYNSAVMVFNIDVQATSTIIFNATKSTVEWVVQSLVGLEVYLPDGRLVADGAENDLHSNEFLVLGIEDGEPGIYEFVFFIGALEPSEDPRDGYYGSYNINVTCIADELSEDSHSSNWFSLNMASGSIKLFGMNPMITMLFMMFWIMCMYLAGWLKQNYKYTWKKASMYGLKAIDWISGRDKDRGGMAVPDQNENLRNGNMDDDESHSSWSMSDYDDTLSSSSEDDAQYIISKRIYIPPNTDSDEESSNDSSSSTGKPRIRFERVEGPAPWIMGSVRRVRERKKRMANAELLRKKRMAENK